MLKNWVLYLLLLAATTVFLLLYPGIVSTAFFFLLLLIVPASILTAAVAMQCLDVRQTVDRTTAVKGDTVQYRAMLRNGSVFLAPRVDVEFYSQDVGLCGDAFHPRRLSILPGQKANCAIDLVCCCRGVFDVGVRRVVVWDALGLIRLRRPMEALDTVVVYPRIVPLLSFPVAAGTAGESSGSAGVGFEKTENVSDIRKYSSGDRLRTVHWKLSAKKDELMVKNFDPAAGANADMILDTACAALDGMQRLLLEDKLVECAVALAHHFTAQSVPARLFYRQGELVLQPLNGMRDFHAAYRSLCDVRFSTGYTAADNCIEVPVREAAARTVIYVTSRLTGELAAASSRLLATGCRVTVLFVDGNQGKAADVECGWKQLTDLGAQVYRTDLEAGLNDAIMGKAAG